MCVRPWGSWADPVKKQSSVTLRPKSASAANSKVLIARFIEPLANQYLLGLNAVNCANGEFIEQVQADSKQDVAKAIDTAVKRLRAKLGESIGSVQKFGAPIEQAMTTSSKRSRPTVWASGIVRARRRRSLSFLQTRHGSRSQLAFCHAARLESTSAAAVSAVL